MSGSFVGALTDRVVLDANGSKISIWARVRHQTARLSAAGDVSHSVVVRFRSDVSPGDAFVYRGRRLQVVGVSDLDGRRAWLSCLVKEAGGQP